MVNLLDTQKIITALNSQLLGKNSVVELAVCSFLSGGHLLIEDVPGAGKTTLAKSLAMAVDGKFSRIQFTSDMLPSDIIGVSLPNPEKTGFVFKKGPLFANFILADEINRASAKTQSALLEAMGERQITVDGTIYNLPDNFMVIATQNAHDSFGTFPLPESQMDRFVMRIDIGYTDFEIEKKIILSHKPYTTIKAIPSVITLTDVLDLKTHVESVHVADELIDYTLHILQKTRDSRFTELGAGTRGGISLNMCAKAMAVIRGRDYVIADDIKNLAVPVLAHRIIIKNAGLTNSKAVSERIIADIADSIEVPL